MPEEHLIVLMIRLGVVASLASILVRSGRFKRMLIREERTLNQRLLLALSFAAIFGAGVAIRVVQQYKAVDLGLEGEPGGRDPGGLRDGPGLGCADLPARHVSPRVPRPCRCWSGSAPWAACCATAPRTPRRSGASRPLFDLSLYRMFSRRHDRYRAAFQLLFLLAILFAEFLRLSLGHVWPKRLVFDLSLLAQPAPAVLRGGLCDHAVRGDAAAEDLEQHPQRNQARGATPSADAGAPGRPEPARSTRTSCSTP